MATYLKELDASAGSDRGSAVDKSYQEIRDLVISFAILPGERINESELSRKLGVSRTPLREALNRLASESFVDYIPSKGFFRRMVRPKEIFDLMQLRIAIETATARLAVQKVSDEQVALLGEILKGLADTRHLKPSAIISIDEHFHETLASFSDNKELLQVLRSVNVRIRPLRFLAAHAERPDIGYRQHQAILGALKARDAALIVETLTAHIERPLDVIEQAVKDLYGRIYVE